MLLARMGLSEDQKLETLPQNWSDPERHQFWFSDQGSKIMPMAWFLNLEHGDPQHMFASSENLWRYGFVKDTSGIDGTLNKYKLPIGFTTGSYNLVEFVGLTCAACHTGNIKFGGRSILVEGAPSMLNFDAFLSDLVTDMQKTRDDQATRERFKARFTTPPDMNDFAARTKRLEVRKRINTPTKPAGFGRVDAFGHIFNQVAVEHLNNPEDFARPPDAPASYPMLWDIAQHLFVQWNYSAPNMGVGPNAVGSLMRNIGEVLGVFGEMEITPGKSPIPIPGITGRPHYRSSAGERIENLKNIEGLVAKLQSPEWPFEKPSDDDKNAGEKIYHDKCEKCHFTTRNPLFYPAFPHSIKEVDTDPDLATAFLERKSLPGKLSGMPKGFLFFSSGLGAGITSFDAKKPEALADLTAHLALNVIPDTLEQVEAFKHGAIEVALVGRGPYYKARPLNGIWASAPYLHNGSVPTLWDLLLPDKINGVSTPGKTRPTLFCVGNGEFDPVKVGYSIPPGPQNKCPDRTALVDTSVRGSLNKGHPYGTELSEADKWKLVAYMKTL